MTNSLTPASIRALRASLTLSQADFGALLNKRVPGLAVNQVTVSRWERGTHQPSRIAAAAIMRLAAKQNITLS